MYYKILDQLKESRIIAVVNLDDPSKAIPLAKSMVEGGVTWIEFTFRNTQAEQVLRVLKNAEIPKLHFGAGTIRTIDQAKIAKDCNAEFLVSPGLNQKIVRWALEQNLLIIPGVDSTLGIETALDLGLNILKFFPADIGGINWLKAINAPYFDVKFIPTGGISQINLVDYLKLPNVLAIGGSFLAPKEMIQKGEFDKIKEICIKTMEIVKSIKN